MWEDEEEMTNDLSIIANRFGRVGINAESSGKSITRVIDAMRLAVVITNAEKSPNSCKRKAYVIYQRTNKKRIKKKQLKIMEG